MEAVVARVAVHRAGVRAAQRRVSQRKRTREPEDGRTTASQRIEPSHQEHASCARTKGWRHSDVLSPIRSDLNMPVRIVQLGSPRRRGEGIRLGTVRRPPRGVRKGSYAAQNWFDVWLPILSPSATLLRRMSIRDDGAGWRAFERRFRAELKRPGPSHVLDTLAALSHVTSFSVGCYCPNERRCHRSVLRRELLKRGAHIR